MLAAFLFMRVVWINDRADFVGGAERYVADAARLTQDRGHGAFLLYDALAWMNPAYTSGFDGAFPMVDVARQIRELKADVVFVHQLASPDRVRAIVESGVPAIRYFHDHRLFCLREHKYTTLGHETCTRPIGAHCYPCLGFVNKDRSRGGLRLRTVGELRSEHRDHDGFAGFMVGSAYMRDHVAAHGFDPGRITVNPPFVPAPPPFEGEAPNRKPDRLLFVGALLRGKGLDVLLRAMPSIPAHVRLRVIGTGAQEQVYRRLVSELALADRVYFAGQASREFVHRAYAESTCVVVPSRTPETFGLTGPEALLHGTPAVASAVGGISEWLKDGETGFAFVSGDAADLARAVNAVLDAPDRAREVALRGKGYVETHFGAGTHADRLIAAFDRVAGGRGGR